MVPQQLRKTILHIDGLRYSFAMASFAGRRLRITLDEIAQKHVAGDITEEEVTSALLDAWSIIDMCHRTRELIQQMPGLSQKLPMINIFLRSTEHIEHLRHYVQHFRSGIPSIPAYSMPLWGGISWVPTTDQTSCFTIHTGTLTEGFETPSISYDTHEFHFTADVNLYAGGVSADIPTVLSLMHRLRDCILQWIEQHPTFTHAADNTLIWRISYTPSKD